MTIPPFVDGNILYAAQLNALVAEAVKTTTSVFNVRDFGAVGDGVTVDTAAIQAALNAVPTTGGSVCIPRGYTFLFNASLMAKTKTEIYGGGILKAAPVGTWVGTSRRGLSNVNNTASVITDTDMVVKDITIDYLGIGVPNAGHLIYFRKVRGVRVEGVTLLGGASSVALVGCDDTQEIGNTYKGFRNCGSDHWDKPTNARVIGCHLETAISSQMLNFNPDPTDVTSAGDTADGLTVSGCTFISTENPSTPIQIEPLRVGGGIVKNVTFTGNMLRGCYLVMRGDVRGATIIGNTFSDFVGDVCAFLSYSMFGSAAQNIAFIGNVIRDPLTSAANIAVIRLESLTSTIAFNRVSGTAYTAATLTTRTAIGQRIGNMTDTTAGVGSLQSGLVLPNGSTNYFGLSDASGGIVSMFIQPDNLMVFHGTNAAGNARNIFSMAMRSDTAEFTTYRDTVHNSAHRWLPNATLAAAGTGISTAAPLTANYNQVIDCVAGVSDGVQLVVSTGRPQTVTNATAAILKVYPHNSGTAQIDAGGNSIPTTIAPGKSKTFVLYSAGNYRTIAVTP